MQLFLKTLSGMANSVDPDQTAYAILSETLVYEVLGHLLYLYLDVSKCISIFKVNGYN